jgi:hypothetical protein
MAAKTEFDRLVEELRPATAPRLTNKRKADCSAEEWAAALNYRRDYKRQPRCRESMKTYNKDYRQKHAARLLDAQRERRRRDSERLRAWHKAYSQRRAEARRAYEREVLRHRVAHLLASRLRTRLYAALKAAGAGKEISAVKDSGMSAHELRAHIEGQFEPGMTWENWGTGDGCWHVDHHFPLSAANLEDPIEQQAVCHYSNLRPAWATENLSKNDSVDPEARANFDRVVATLRGSQQPAAAARGGVLQQVAALALRSVARIWRVLGGRKSALPSQGVARRAGSPAERRRASPPA